MKKHEFFLTATAESLAATAKISAQDTTPGHKFSNWDLIVSITSYPLSEGFGPTFFSPGSVAVLSKSTDASHPYYKMLYKHVIFSTKWEVHIPLT